MNTLKDFDWDIRYSSSTHNLIEDFFIPALSRSRFYYRIAGYFSSMVLAAAAKGISAFIDSGEKIFLVVGANFQSQEEINAINKGELKTEDLLEKQWSECKKEFENDIIKKRLELLSWMIAHDKLELLIGINKDKNGNYLSSKESNFHEKVLIFEDFEGNMIQIDGSVNETWKAWQSNRESFCVHKSWVENQQEFVVSAKRDFDKVWTNRDFSCELMHLPKAIKNDLISIAPKTKPSIKEEVEFNPEEFQKSSIKKELRLYQKEAIEAWEKHDCIGILEMATGTGKTFTALKAIERLDLNSKFLIIGVPQKDLVHQWAGECEKVFNKVKKRIVLCYGGSDWKKSLSRIIRQTKREESFCIIIAVYNSMRMKEFINEIKEIEKDLFLLFDEVHEVGSPENLKLLSELSETTIRLGLSATPERVWDSEGNQVIEQFFGGKPIFIWDLNKAINPPKGYERCLVPYKYYIHEASLNDSELIEYEELSNDINKKVAILKNSKKSLNYEDSLKLQLFKRAKIIKKCKDKIRILEEILEKHHSNLKKCLVYCNDEEHMDEVTKIIMGRGFSCRKFFGIMDSEEREKVFDSFNNDNVQFIVAIKCLDQGIDLPICNSAIILTSSQNPREYVQRRGRILRLHEEKDFAIVHDILVFPYNISELKSGKTRLHEFEANLLDNQLSRIDIFIENSMNKSENFLKKLDYGDIIINSLGDGLNG